MRFLLWCFLIANVINAMEDGSRKLFTIIRDKTATAQSVKNLLNKDANPFRKLPCVIEGEQFGCEDYCAAELAARNNLDIWGVLVAHYSQNRDLVQLFHCSLYNPDATKRLLSAHKDFFNTLSFDKKDQRSELFYTEECLHTACELENVSAVQFLIKHGCDVNYKDTDGRTALYEMMNYRHKNTEIVSYLLDCGAEVNYNKEMGGTPLHRALKTHVPYEFIRLLIQKGKADVNLADSVDNYSPLMIAAYHCYHPKTFFLLLENGAAVNYQERINGYSALRELCRRSTIDLEDADVQDMLKLLLLYKANIGLKDIHKKRAVDYVKQSSLKKFLSCEIDPLDSDEHPEKYIDTTCDDFNPVKKFPQEFTEIQAKVQAWQKELAKE